MHHDKLTPVLHHDVILLKHDRQFIELLPRPGQITSAWIQHPTQSSANCCRNRTCGCFDNQMVSPTANTPSTPLPFSGSNTEGQEECTLRAKVLKVVKSNDSVC